MIFLLVFGFWLNGLKIKGVDIHKKRVIAIDFDYNDEF